MPSTPITGRDGVAKTLSGFLAAASTVDWQIVRQWTVGRTVINERLDRFQIGDGFTMTLDNSILGLVAGGNDGVGGEPAGTGVTVNVTSGSQLNPFFIVNAVTVNVDASSSASFGGGGTPINLSTVSLAPGSSLTLASLAEFTEQGTKIFVNGVSFASNSTILNSSGNTGTAIPEPSGLALLGLAGLACLFRRRK
jgi:hypothetical protein